MAMGRTTKTRGRKRAKALRARLEDEAFRARARFTADEMKVLDRICSGKYVRNASAIQKAFEFRASYAYPKPKQSVEVTTPMDPGDIPDEQWERLALLEHEVLAKDGTDED